MTKNLAVIVSILTLILVPSFVYYFHLNQIINDLSEKIVSLNAEKTILEQTVSDIRNENDILKSENKRIVDINHQALLYATAQDTYLDIQRFRQSPTSTRYGATNNMELLNNLVNAVTDVKDQNLDKMMDAISGNATQQAAESAHKEFLLYNSAKIIEVLSESATSS